MEGRLARYILVSDVLPRSPRHVRATRSGRACPRTLARAIPSRNRARPFHPSYSGRAFSWVTGPGRHRPRHGASESPSAPGNSRALSVSPASSLSLRAWSPTRVLVPRSLQQLGTQSVYANRFCACTGGFESIRVLGQLEASKAGRPNALGNTRPWAPCQSVARPMASSVGLQARGAAGRLRRPATRKCQSRWLAASWRLTCHQSREPSIPDAGSLAVAPAFKFSTLR